MGCHDLRVVALLVLTRFILESEKKMTQNLSATVSTVMNESMIGNWGTWRKNRIWVSGLYPVLTGTGRASL